MGLSSFLGLIPEPWGEVLMQLGEFQFRLSSAAYQQLKRTHEYRWPLQAPLGRAPAAQYLGPGEETLELEGTIYPGKAGSADAMDDLRKQAANGEALVLTDWQGKVWGDYAITRTEETQRVLAPNGRPLKIDFRLKLQATGDSEDGLNLPLP